MSKSVQDTMYDQVLRQRSDINEHLPVLNELAKQCQSVVEFGFRTGVSTIALLHSGAKVTSYDIGHCRPAVSNIAAAFPNLTFRKQSSLEADIPSCDMLFIDSKHDFAVLSKELARHHRKVRRWIVMHDTETFRDRGQTKGDRGLQPAIDAFLRARHEWALKAHYKNNNGLTILERNTDVKEATA